MGVSTDAKLFYGFPLDEDSKAGELISEYEGDGSEDRPTPASLGWLAASGEQDGSIGIGFHCSDEYPMHFIAIESSVVIANRGYPVRIKDLKVGRTWDRELLSFCEAYGIKPGKIGWWMCSEWG